MKTITREADRFEAMQGWVYRSSDAVDPYSGYKGKAFPGYLQTLRAVSKDCVPVDGHYPLIYREKAPDGFWRLHDISGVGDIDGPSIEYHLFTAATGVSWSEEEFDRVVERVCALKHALQTRHWTRDQAMDEAVLPSFEHTELYPSPFLEKRHRLERKHIDPIMDDFYELHGWDRENVWPTREQLRRLDLEDVYEPMVSGAARVRAPV